MNREGMIKEIRENFLIEDSQGTKTLESHEVKVLMLIIDKHLNTLAKVHATIYSKIMTDTIKTIELLKKQL